MIGSHPKPVLLNSLAMQSVFMFPKVQLSSMLVLLEPKT